MSAMPRYDAGDATGDAWPAILSVTEPEVRTRIRIAHTRTQRDGWGYETTVEVEYAGTDDTEARERLDWLLLTAELLGRREADERNTIERLRTGGEA